MISTIFNLLPTMIAAATVPGWTLLMLMLLQERASLRTPTWFLAGILGSRALQGLLVAWVTVSLHSVGDRRVSSALTSLLEIIIGLAMLGTAIRAISKTPDPDAPPPQWLHRIQSASPWMAMLAGCFLVLVGTRQWIFAFGAVRMISNNDLDTAPATLVYLVFAIGASLPLIIPYLLRAFGGASSRNLLDSVDGWLTRHGPTLISLTSLALGIYFLGKGLSTVID